MQCTRCKTGELIPSKIENNFKAHTCNHCGGNWIHLDDYFDWQKQQTPMKPPLSKTIMVMTTVVLSVVKFLRMQDLYQTKDPYKKRLMLKNNASNKTWATLLSSLIGNPSSNTKHLTQTKRSKINLINLLNTVTAPLKLATTCYGKVFQKLQSKLSKRREGIYTSRL